MQHREGGVARIAIVVNSCAKPLKPKVKFQWFHPVSTVSNAPTETNETFTAVSL